MLFILIKILTVLPVLSHATKSKKLEAEYLAQLIEERMKEAQSYVPRTDNSDFFKDVNDSTVYDYGEYDFIVVGAGSTGSVVATRLAEIVNWTILVVEAGYYGDILASIPGLWEFSLYSHLNWGYMTEPEKHGCFGMMGNKCTYPQGLALGGSGGINQLAYVRGTKGDYDRWEKAGNPGWSYRGVLPYFKKAMNFSLSDGDKGYHGKNGPIYVEYSSVIPYLHNIFMEANKERYGYKKIDYNGRSMLGASVLQQNTRRGVRQSGTNRYLAKALEKSNIDLLTRAFAYKILINEDKVAYGVEFVRDGRIYKATVRKEVILSAGATNTPQLLMLSGIGPKDELEKHGINVIRNSPVGQNVKDHYTFSVFVRTNYTNPTRPFVELTEEYLNGKGVLTSATQRSIAFYKLPSNPTPVPDIEIIANTPTSRPYLGVETKAFNYDPNMVALFRTRNQTTDYEMEIFLLHPKSVGKITLKSSDPVKFPNFNSGILSAPEDVETLYEGVNIIYNLTETGAYKRIQAKPFFRIKACEESTSTRKEYWFCAIRSTAFPGRHVTSSTKMGAPDDPTAVVDSSLRVYGIRGLRVVDVGVAPDPISGHTNAVAFMIGEKGSDIIKVDHGVLQLSVK